MKKKFFTTLVLFASLALTACGGASTNAEWKSNTTKHWHENGGKKVDEAAHVFEEEKDKAVAPTCSSEGKKFEKCKVCGYEKESKVSKLAHTYGEWTNKDGAYCGPSEREHECTVCHQKESEKLPIVQHTWVETGTVAEGDGGHAYSLVKCSVCQKEGLMVSVIDSEVEFTSSDTSKQKLKAAPEGCVKLPSNGDNFTVKIKLAEAKTGKLFMRGSMDYWYTDSNKNEQKGIYNGQSGGAASKDSGIANFKLEVGAGDNLSQVALTGNKDLLYKDFLPAEPGFTNVANTDWSQIGDIEVGDVSLAAGLNTIKFTRVDSYNIAIHDFVVTFANAA